MNYDVSYTVYHPEHSGFIEFSNRHDLNYPEGITCVNWIDGITSWWSSVNNLREVLLTESILDLKLFEKSETRIIFHEEQIKKWIVVPVNPEKSVICPGQPEFTIYPEPDFAAADTLANYLLGV